MDTTSARSTGAAATRDRIIAAASALLTAGGRDAVSTRAVSLEAGVQAPTIYRIFGDKQGLLDAVALDGYLTYLEAHSQRADSGDAVHDMRIGWDLHIAFGLAHPHVYSLIYGQPDPGATSPAVAAAFDVIRRLVERLAESSRLRIPVDRAVLLANAVGSGTVLTLIGMPEGSRDPALADIAREAMMAAITTDEPITAGGGAASAAVTLHALLPQSTELTGNERALMGDWLDRISRAR